jgi:hypothetical protein
MRRNYKPKIPTERKLYLRPHDYEAKKWKGALIFVGVILALFSLKANSPIVPVMLFCGIAIWIVVGLWETFKQWRNKWKSGH